MKGNGYSKVGVSSLKFLGEDGQILTAGKSGKIPPGQVNGNTGNGNGGNTESFRFFYHPDHVGSTSYITDATGEVYQHLEYFAFGETFVEEHRNTNRTPYLFNGKELDDETGLYYYGARYYEPVLSIWQSVDNFADKYPGISPYSYVANNPINYTDPTGDTIKVQGRAEFVSAVNEKINFIKENSRKGRRIIERLEKSENVHIIQEVFESMEKGTSGGEYAAKLRTKVSSGEMTPEQYIEATMNNRYSGATVSESTLNNWQNSEAFDIRDMDGTGTGSIMYLGFEGLQNTGKWDSQEKGHALGTLIHEFSHLNDYDRGKANRKVQSNGYSGTENKAVKTSDKGLRQINRKTNSNYILRKGYGKSW